MSTLHGRLLNLPVGRRSVCDVIQGGLSHLMTSPCGRERLHITVSGLANPVPEVGHSGVDAWEYGVTGTNTPWRQSYKNLLTAIDTGQRAATVTLQSRSKEGAFLNWSAVYREPNCCILNSFRGPTCDTGFTSRPTYIRVICRILKIGLKHAWNENIAPHPLGI